MFIDTLPKEITLIRKVFVFPSRILKGKDLFLTERAYSLRVALIGPGFSFDSISAVPDSYFWAGTPTFQENLTKLHGGTPTFLIKCPWDSHLENPSENPHWIRVSHIRGNKYYSVKVVFQIENWWPKHGGVSVFIA